MSEPFPAMIQRLADDAIREAGEAEAKGETARARRLTLGAAAVHSAIDEAVTFGDGDAPFRLLLALQSGLNREETLTTDGDEAGGEVVERALGQIVEVIKQGSGPGQRSARIGRQILDRIIAATLDGERDWAGRAMLRGESDNARLCLDAVSRLESAIRRAQDGAGDYGVRLATELQDCLADWESQVSDEDGYGSSSIHRISGLVEAIAANGVDDSPGPHEDA